MKIETRLEKLEHEFKVLKNEIQATLLEIQEQVLNRYYPALRAEEDEMEVAPPRAETPKANVRQTRPAGERLALDGNGGGEERRSINGNGGNRNGGNGMNGNAAANGHTARGSNGPAATEHTSPFSDALDDLLDDDDLDDDQGPSLREVSFAELKRSPGENRAATPAKRAPVGEASPVNFAVLADWVGESTRKLGQERTIRAVETYAASGNLAAASKAMIMQLIELAGEDGPQEPPAAAATMEVLVKLDQLLRGA